MSACQRARRQFSVATRHIACWKSHCLAVKDCVAVPAAEEMPTPKGVMLADERVMAAEIFDPDHDYEDGVPCAAHEAPLALTLLMYFCCRRGAACHAP